MKFVYTTNNKAIYIDISDITKITDQLEPGIYNIETGAFGHWNLVKKQDFYQTTEPFGEKTRKRIQRVLSTFEKVQPLAALFHGEKGTGKTLSVKIIANELIERNYSVIEITSDVPYPIIKTIYEKFDKVVIIFDEFEKNFLASSARLQGPRSVDNSDETVYQEKFLSLFDGVCYNRDRLTLITVNEIGSVSSYFLNRPSRIRYVFFYSHLDDKTVREFVEANNIEINENDIKVLTSLKMNFDLLQTIIDEVKLGYNIGDILEALGIDRTIYLVPEKIVNTRTKEELPINGETLTEKLIDIYNFDRETLQFIIGKNSLYSIKNEIIRCEVNYFQNFDDTSGITVPIEDLDGAEEITELESSIIRSIFNDNPLSLLTKINKIGTNNNKQIMFYVDATFNNVSENGRYTFTMCRYPFIELVFKDITTEISKAY